MPYYIVVFCIQIIKHPAHDETNEEAQEIAETFIFGPANE